MYKWNEMTSRERDALVHEEVFEQSTDVCNKDWWYVVQEEIENYSPFDFPVPYYTTDISVAWKVVEKMISDSNRYPNIFHLSKFENHGFACEFNQKTYACVKTPSESICLAALKAVGVDIE